MNKIALALVLALGTAHVSAADTKPVVDATLDARIRSLNLSEEKKSAILDLAKDHYIITAAVAAVVLAGVAYGADHYFNKGNAWAAVVTFLTENISTPVGNGWDTYGFGSVKGKGDVVTPGTLRAHPYYTTGAVLLVAAAIFAAFDLRKEEDKSLLKSSLKKLMAKKADTPVVA